ncbi:putative long-chain-fatty-acid--CoA ligase [Tribonema minus]|uniref:Long-chain-fatty-acid--CoA ligase n=1 Tax=Tribonema minus TaxID=303371 RepID=A0A836CDA2_9STRA|nr:putative long-chain-fatty-acid--CoA ligase [Tribonema minus]
MTTLHDNYQYATKMYPDHNCYGWRPKDSAGNAGPYKWMTYKEANTAAKEFGDGLMADDMIPPVTQGGYTLRMLALFSKNRPEWTIAEQACFMHAGTTVPLYDTLAPDVVAYVLNQTKLSTVVCAATETPKVLSSASQCPDLKFIVQMEPPSAEQAAEAKAAGVTLLSFDAVRERGRGSPGSSEPPTPDSIATFCYTSGTTGMPKGALLSHENLFSALAGANVRGIRTTEREVHLSYLPLAHVMERLVQITLINTGAAIGFYQGDTLKITSDLAELHPTIFPSVPRLLNKVYDKIMAGATASPVKKFLFTTALAAKTARMRATGDLHHPFWDKLVFSKVAKKLGLERCRLIVTGSAPISADVMDFLRVVFSSVVIEGYGQSETAAAGTLTSIADVSSGHVGGPSPSTEIKLVSVPDMGYLSTDTEHDAGEGNAIPCAGRGEICFRGPSVFKGYYMMPDKTAEAIDSDGWTHTGDVGIWLPTGQLKIVDRVKNMFKLSQGEYVAAEKVENVYATCAAVAQSFVYGDSLQSCVVAIVVPDFDVLGKWAADNGKSAKPEDLVKDAAAVKWVLGEMTVTGRAAKLHGFELAKAVHLVVEPFSVDNDLLTPTFKLKRFQAKKLFKKEIAAMYASLK